MPLELQVIRACEFIRVGAHGRLDLEASKAALSTLARACRKRGIHQALLDLRNVQPGATPAFTPTDLAALLNTFREMGFTEQHRVALLYSSDPHRRARLFAALGRLHGWSVGAFESFEAALVWLAGEETVDLTACAAQNPIPVKRIRARRSAIQRTPPSRPEMN